MVGENPVDPAPTNYDEACDCKTDLKLHAARKSYGARAVVAARFDLYGVQAAVAASLHV